MKRRLTAALLLFALLLALVPGALAADAPAKTSNKGDYEYSYNRWANPINSYLVDNGDGTLTRVEYTGEAVTVETYDSDLQFVDGFTVDMELPIFGGFYSGETCNFLIFGQKNPDEDDAVEVIRVVSYTKDWARIDAASLYGANTYIPFDAGSLRCAEYGGYLYIRTAHEMYMSSDGLHHQANLTMNVRISDMTVTDSFSKVMNISYGYVSHSFNQFITVDGTDLVAVDHGDAHPRSVVLTKYNAPAGQDSFMEYTLEPVGNGYYTYVYTKYVEVLPIMGSTGDNDTGVALGGFEISDSSYLIAGNTVSQDENYKEDGQRNIFVSATSRGEFASATTNINYLTAYAEGDAVTLSNPHFAKIDSDRYIVLWTESGSETSGLRYAFVDGTGTLVGEIYTTEGLLSDCQPIVSGDQVIWYVTSGSAPAFYIIDLNDPSNPVHGHNYTYTMKVEPTFTSERSLSAACTICGAEGEDVIMPILNLEDYTIRLSSIANCTHGGFDDYYWNETMYGSFKARVYTNRTEHDPFKVEAVAATCVAEGNIEYWDCTTCLNLYWKDEALTTRVKEITTPINPDNHTGETEVQSSVAATCTTPGYTGDTVCLDCGEVTTPGTETELADHAYTNHVCDACGAAEPVAAGDLNGDYKLNVSDILLMKQLILRKDITAAEITAADVSGDGKVNAVDIILLKNHILEG